MRTLVISALLLLAPFYAYCKEQEKDDFGTGAFFLRYCDDPNMFSHCVTYMSGYVQGLYDGMNRADKAATGYWQMFGEKCRQGEKAYCDLPPGPVVKAEYQGCSDEAANLPQSAIRALLVTSLKKNPERLKWDYGRIYRKTIEEAFPCKK